MEAPNRGVSVPLVLGVSVVVVVLAEVIEV
jgi:hypothetical protein